MNPSGKRDVPLQCAADTIKRHDIAALGESLAAAHLQNQGCQLICRNWRSGRFGEIDLIMQAPDGLLVFIEVKTRRCNRDSKNNVDAGYDAVNWRKRRKILIAVQSYLACSGQTSASARVDVVIVRFDNARLTDGHLELRLPEVLHVPQAFDSI